MSTKVDVLTAALERVVGECHDACKSVPTIDTLSRTVTSILMHSVRALTEARAVEPEDKP